MTAGPPAPVRPSVLLAYASPAFVVALPTLPVYVHLPALYGVELGVGLAATGLVLLAARLFDTLTDPVVGYLGDRFPFRGLRRKPWIAMGAVIAAVGLVKILDPPAGVGAGYLLIWSLVLYAGWTLVAVPYQAWGAELSRGYNERTRITGWREALALAGMVGAGALTAVAPEVDVLRELGPGVIACAAVLIGAVLFPLLLIRVPEPPRMALAGMDDDRRPVVRLASLISNRPFLRLLAAWFLNGLSNGIPASLFYIYLEHGVGVDADSRPLFVLAYFAAAILAVPLWLQFSRRAGKHRAWCWAMAGACAAFVLVPWIPPGSWMAFLAVCLVTGTALGADLALPPSLQADVVDYDRWRFDQDRTGLQFALWGMATKLSLAAAVGLALPGVAYLGFDPAAPTDQGRTALTVIYSVVPVVIKVSVIAVIWRFPLTPSRHGILRRRLEARDRRRRQGEGP